ncbi:MAG: RIP metalloprotease RseP [Verrucomicrobiales bacterium]|nr:RIP metalloprotease RseP [Verrucomicrobiales bacterium]
MDSIIGLGKILWTLFQVIVLFNILIVVHELGHYWAAKWRGLKVEKFQIWFGKPIWKKKIKDVQWGLGWIPMGGFVALPQMAPMEMLEGKNEEKESLLPITPKDKIIVAFAGPLFSFGLAFAFALLVWGFGKPVREQLQSTVVGSVVPGMPAELAGVRPGDQILEIDGVKVLSFAGMVDSVLERIIYSEGEEIVLLIKRQGINEPVEIRCGFDKEERPAHQRQDFRRIGVTPISEAIVDMTISNSPADRAGLKSGDKILQANGQELFGRETLSFMIQKMGDDIKSIELLVLRGSEKIKVLIVPEFPTQPEGKPAMLGLQWQLPPMTIEIPGPNPFTQIWNGATAIYRTLSALMPWHDADVSVSQMSSAVGIGRYYYETLSDPVYGWRFAFVLSVLINVNLGMLNLLPLPVLDGGHITMALYEWIFKSPLNIKLMEMLQFGCALLLISFMIYVTWFDIGDLSSESEDSEPIVFSP